MFTDVAQLEIRAGKGGDGRSSFRHEKYRDMGGPDGGDGGRGGNVVFVVDHNANTLSYYRTARLIAAQDGQVGRENRSRGKGGEDIIVKVPPGTQVWEDEEMLADLTTDGQTEILAKGGRGGFGNAHFISSVRQAPRTSELGELGERHRVRLELKLVADVGLVGLPNAGKSTLLSVISNARPEIGDYAFTTLVPNLGVVDHRDYTFLAADIPGLIEGASEGRGLGDEFLRHIERTAVLIQLVDAGSEDVAEDWRQVNDELAAYGHGLAEKARLIALTKTETVAPDEVAIQKKKLEKLSGGQVFVISAQAHQGLDVLLDAAVKLVKTAREQQAAAQAEAEIPVIDTIELPDLWRVEDEGDGVFRVIGERIEGFARRTNFDQDDGVARLRDILRKTGVARGLRRAGIQDGDTIRIGESELAWLD